MRTAAALLLLVLAGSAIAILDTVAFESEFAALRKEQTQRQAQLDQRLQTLIATNEGVRAHIEQMSSNSAEHANSLYSNAGARNDIPASYNFIEAHPQCKPKIRNQAGCGSCWSFALATAVSARMCLKSGDRYNVEISSEQMIDCPHYMLEYGDIYLDGMGCDGGWSWLAAQNMNHHAGAHLVTEACNPYLGLNIPTGMKYPRDGDYPDTGRGCPVSRCPATGASSYYPNDGAAPMKMWLQPNPAAIAVVANATHPQVEMYKQALLDNGPLVVNIEVYDSFYALNAVNYTYNPPQGDDLLYAPGGHAVTLVGWEGDDWIIQNSWGPYWGNHGFFKARMNNTLIKLETRFGSGVDMLPIVPDFMFTAPRGLNNFAQGQQITVSWVNRAAIDGQVDTVSVFLTSDTDPALKYTLASNVANTGSLTFVMPSVTTGKFYTLRIHATGTPFHGESERFGIVAPTAGYIDAIYNPGQGNALDNDNTLAQPGINTHYCPKRHMVVRWAVAGGVSSAQPEKATISIVRMNHNLAAFIVDVDVTAGYYEFEMPTLGSDPQYLVRMYVDSAFPRYSAPFTYSSSCANTFGWDPLPGGPAAVFPGAALTIGSTVSLSWHPCIEGAMCPTGLVAMLVSLGIPTVMSPLFSDTVGNASTLSIPDYGYSQRFSYLVVANPANPAQREFFPLYINNAQTVAVTAPAAGATIQAGTTMPIVLALTGEMFDAVDVMLIGGNDWWGIAAGWETRKPLTYAVPTNMPAGPYFLAVRNSRNHAVGVYSQNFTITANPCAALGSQLTCVAEAQCGYCQADSLGCMLGDASGSSSRFCHSGSWRYNTTESVGDPVVSALHPSSGPKDAATTIVIEGSNFHPDTYVQMFGNRLPVKYLSPTALEIRAPLSSATSAYGSYNVYVYNQGTSYNSLSFTLTDTATCPASTASPLTARTGQVGVTDTYTADMDCRWTISVTGRDTNEGVAFAFETLDLAPNQDFLYIYNGADTTAPLIGAFTGTNKPLSPVNTAVCTGSSCLVRLVTANGTKTGHAGFNVTYMTVQGPGPKACPKTWSSYFTASEGTITLSSEDYGNLMSCSFYIQPSGMADNEVVGMTFEELDLEPGFDTVTVTSYSRKMGAWSSKAELGNRTLLCKSNCHVELKTDAYVSGHTGLRGFRLHYVVRTNCPDSSYTVSGQALTAGNMTALLDIDQFQYFSYMDCAWKIEAPAKEATESIVFGLSRINMYDWYSSSDQLKFSCGGATYDAGTLLSPTYTGSTAPYSMPVCDQSTAWVHLTTGYYGHGREGFTLGYGTAAPAPCPDKTLTTQTGQFGVNATAVASWTKCTWTITSGKASNEEVGFLVDSLDLAPGHVIQFYEGAPSTGSKIHTIPGDSSYWYRVPACTTATCTVVFDTAGYAMWPKVSGGFHLAYSVAQASGVVPKTAGTTLTARRGHIALTSPEYVDNMVEASSYWLVQPTPAPAAGERLVFSFSLIDTESGYDYVRIYSGAAADEDKRIGTFSGSHRSEYAAVHETPITCPGSTCRVTFRSDGGSSGNNYIGFVLNYWVERAQDKCPPSTEVTATGRAGTVAMVGHEYRPFMECMWRVSPAGRLPTEVVVFTVDSVITEAWDKVSVFDGASNATAITRGPSSQDFLSGNNVVAKDAVVAGCYGGVCSVGFKTIQSHKAYPMWSLNYHLENDTCQTMRSCARCAATAGCGWCAEAERCMRIGPSRDLYGNCPYTSTWTVSAGSCQTYEHPAPVVTSLTPTSGKGGDSVTITGEGFNTTGTTQVLFCGVFVEATVASVTSLRFTVPGGLGGGYCWVFVRNPDGQYSEDFLGFELEGSGGGAKSHPAIASVSPAKGTVKGGVAVTVTGTDFRAGASVSFCGTAAASVTFVSASTLKATTPAHAAGSCTVRVTNPDGAYALLGAAFEYVDDAPVPPVTPPSMVGPIVGGILGGLVVLALLVGGGVFLYCRCRPGAQKSAAAAPGGAAPQATGIQMQSNPMRQSRV